MDTKKIMSYVDHTLLAQGATEEQIMQICDDAVTFGTASVCIPPSYVHFAKNYLGDIVRICTVVGFPNGYSTTSVKCAETADAILNGADEIDMVINITDVKNGHYDIVLDEIRQIKGVCGEKVLKVIIETCLLSDEEKIRMCDVVNLSGADYIKTSTGFAGGGATFEDVSLLAKHIGATVKIKAAGGIKSFDDAQRYIELGASRLGTSRLVSILKSQESESKY